jgi:hypothetical protein
MEWFDEKIEYIEGDKFLYKLVCFCLKGPKKRLSYKELYLLLYGLNKRKLGEENAKKKTMERILKIYKSHHNNNEPNFDE